MTHTPRPISSIVCLGLLFAVPAANAVYWITHPKGTYRSVAFDHWNVLDVLVPVSSAAIVLPVAFHLMRAANPTHSKTNLTALCFAGVLMTLSIMAALVQAPA